MARYKVLSGVHSQQGKIWRPGEIVESEADLEALHNHPGSRRYARVDDPAVNGTPLDESFTVTQPLDSSPVIVFQTLGEGKVSEQPSPSPFPSFSLEPPPSKSDEAIEDAVKNSSDFPNESWSLADLRAFANNSEIDIEGLKTRREILREIAAVRGTRS